MKHNWVLCLALAGCLSLTGCGKPSDSSSKATNSTSNSGASISSDNSMLSVYAPDASFTLEKYVEGLTEIPTYTATYSDYPNQDWNPVPGDTPTAEDVAKIKVFNVTVGSSDLGTYVFNPTPYEIKCGDYIVPEYSTTSRYEMPADTKFSVDDLSVVPLLSNQLAMGTVTEVSDVDDRCFAVAYTLETDIQIDATHPVFVESYWLNGDTIASMHGKGSIGTEDVNSRGAITSPDCVVREYHYKLSGEMPAVGDKLYVFVRTASYMTLTDGTPDVKLYSLGDNKGLIHIFSGTYGYMDSVEVTPDYRLNHNLDSVGSDSWVLVDNMHLGDQFKYVYTPATDIDTSYTFKQFADNEVKECYFDEHGYLHVQSDCELYAYVATDGSIKLATFLDYLTNNEVKSVIAMYDYNG